MTTDGGQAPPLMSPSLPKYHPPLAGERARAYRESQTTELVNLGTSFKSPK